ncbi:unnamed protein product [Cylindrotheca closterium]|uniref:Uncharacterized protein n=1 Tax=Cylindrotheca closterium TaxID=2856 RepID=A0AAD2CCZ1_9STRA|nr:unnamed protein product [Cylindrotheca closterium]
MSNLRPSVRSAIKSFIQTQDGSQIASDVLRVIHEEALLMKETEDTRDMFETDPFEAFEKMKSQIRQFKSMIQVTSCSRVRTRKYVANDAVVTIDNGKDLQLTFRYEQKPREGTTKGTQIWYSIEMAENSYSERQNLLVVQVWSPGDAPCTDTAAVCINDQMMEEEENEDDLWSDIDDDEEVVHEVNAETKKQNPPSTSPANDRNPSKRAKLSENSGAAPQAQGNEGEQEDDDEHENCDTYMAFMDPELLHSFLTATKFGPMDEDTAFFLLMTFPFYEHEWDLIGFVLSEVFGSDEDLEDSQPAQ